MIIVACKTALAENRIQSSAYSTQNTWLRGSVKMMGASFFDKSGRHHSGVINQPI